MAVCNNSGQGRSTIIPRKQLLMATWLLATPESYRSIADRFGVSKSTLWNCCDRVWKALSALSSEVIQWPSLSEMQVIADNFEKIASFPGVVGCIDGSHIPIKAPCVHPESYVNRKGFHSILLQAVVDYRYRFTDCYAGEVGSVHDARVFRRSKLGQELSAKVPANMHIIGDSAYPLLPNVMTPFKNNGHLSRKQISYNQSLSKTRCIVERAFALLKGRFRRLKYLDMWRTDMIPMVIIVGCVMHNICQLLDDELVEDISVEYNDDDSGGMTVNSIDSSTGIQKRSLILANF